MSRWIYILMIACVVGHGSASAQDTTQVDREVSTIGQIVQTYFNLVSGPAGKRDWARMRQLYTKNARIHAIRYDVNGYTRTRFGNVEDFISNVDPFLLKHDFYQEEIAKKVEYYGNMAQVIASYYLVYNKYGSKVQFEDRGVVSFQLIYDQQRWWIANLIWNSELDDEPIPDEFLGLAPPPAINPPASTTNTTDANTTVPPARKAAKPFPMNQVEQLPAYPGGPSAMMEFLETRSALPPDMRASGIKGKVKVQFVITREGQLSNVEVVEAAHPKLGDQARRILEDMPPWQPGTVGGLPVDVQYLPITLTLE